MTPQHTPTYQRSPELVNDVPRRLAALHDTQLLDTPEEERFDSLTRLACRLFNVPIALISLLDAHRQWFKSTCGLGLHETPLEDSFCAHALLSQGIMVVEDALTDPRFSDNPLVQGEPYIRFYAGAPIYGPGQVPLGTFCIISDSPRALDEHERETLLGLARLTTLEIERRTVRHEMQTCPQSEAMLRLSISSMISHIERRHIAGDSPRLVLLELLDELLRFFQCEYGLVGELTDAPHRQLAILGLSIGGVSASAQSFFQHTGRELDLARLDALTAGRFSSNSVEVFPDHDFVDLDPRRLPPGHPPLRNALMIPLIVGEVSAGMLVLANTRHGFQAERDTRLLQPVAALGGRLLDSLREIQDKARLQARLEEFRATLDATLDLILIVDEQTQRVTYCNRGAIERLGYSRDELLTTCPSLLDEALSTTALGARLTALGGQQALRLNANLRCRGGETLPVQAQIQRTAPSNTGKPQIIVVARDLRETLEAQREIEWITHHDGLTHQLNRTGFLRALARGDKAPEQCTTIQLVAVFGIDRFKRINDAHGTAQADAILCELAQHLSSLLAPYVDAHLGRLGGDEFAVSVPLAQACEAPQLAERLRAAVERHRFRAIEGLQLTVSVGLTAHSLDQTAPEELLRRANAALVRAKQHGRNRVRQYLSGMLDEASRHEAIERRLAGAFERREFHLVFQPQWALQALGRPCGAEALLRWQAPDQETVGPDVFVPILEQSGLMVEVGRWIIDQALDALAAHRQRLPADFFVSVNISAIQLMDDTRLADYLVEALRRRGLPASMLELEITETALIQSPHWVGQQLEALHERSIAIALDDFGTGFSSLSHLKQFPFDTVKIDKSFIAGLPGSPEDRAIVESLLTLCRGFGRDVCAEGIETPAQLDYLRRLGCNRAQGYLLARPGRDLLAYSEE